MIDLMKKLFRLLVNSRSKFTICVAGWVALNFRQNQRGKLNIIGLLILSAAKGIKIISVLGKLYMKKNDFLQLLF